MNRRRSLCGFVFAGLIAGQVSLGRPAPAAAEPARPPKLLVFLSVDQMRADYHEWYGANWKRGLRRLYDQGAQFTNAAFPYLNTVTCPGHATLGTGAYPNTHGMILNGWYDRTRKKVIECTDDPSTPLLAYAPARLDAGDSAKNLMVPTVGDELQAQLKPAAKVVGLSWKARSAIDMAGHKPDLVLWFESSSWVTSTAFATATTPWVDAFLKANPVDALLETSWTKALPDKAYKFEDDASGEKPPSGWDKTFPHPLGPQSPPPGGRPSAVTPGRFGKWGSSPFVDEYLGKMARAAVKEMKLGQGPGTDYLAISFSMTDAVGHAFGPRSHEVQDTLIRLDATIGDLLDNLDKTVGKDNYVVALSADHGVALIPEQAKAMGKDAGRISGTEIKKKAAEAISAELGKESPTVAEFTGNDLYLQPGVYDKLAGKPGAMKRVMDAVRTAAGVGEVMDSAELKDPTKVADPLRRAAALSYYPGRSGDILIAPKADWIVGSSIGTTHGSTHDYDQRVPVLFYGAGIKKARYDRRVSPADIAPTLAELAGVKMPKAQGQVLTEIAGAAPAVASPVRARKGKIRK